MVHTNSDTLGNCIEVIHLGLYLKKTGTRVRKMDVKQVLIVIYETMCNIGNPSFQTLEELRLSVKGVGPSRPEIKS